MPASARHLLCSSRSNPSVADALGVRGVRGITKLVAAFALTPLGLGALQVASAQTLPAVTIKADADDGYVELRRSYGDMLSMNLDQIYFDASSGIVLHSFEAAPIMASQRFLTGLHRSQWSHWWLRWLYFGAGLMGCVMVATGLLFWLESRRTRHAKMRLAGVQLVEAMAVFSVPGILIATLVFLVANRLLPQEAAFAGLGRAGLEMSAFYMAWSVALLHAAVRARAAWLEQTGAIGGLAALAVVLNGATTGHYLDFTLSHGLWAVAGMDLLLLATALLSIAVARRLARRAPDDPSKLGAELTDNTTRHA